MVQVKENELIITIKTNNAAQTLTEYRDSIIEAMACYNSGNEDNIVRASLSELLKELLPTFEQNKVMLSANN